MSAISYFLPAPPDGFSTTLSSSIGTTALTVPLNSVVGLETEGVGVFFKKDTTGAVVAGSIEYVHWTGVSGNNLTLSDTGDRGLTGSSAGAQAYTTGDTFEVWVSGQYYYKKVRDGVQVEHNQDGTHKLAALASLLYPVGTIYANETDSRNPSVIFGFGTWAAIAGRVIVGVGTSDQVFAAGATGGESTHLLTGAESGEKGHNHIQDQHRHSFIIHDSPTGTGFTDSSGNLPNAAFNTDYATATNQAVPASNAASAHNNLQPYQTAYVWKRTA
jgi:hypothetical protein